MPCKHKRDCPVCDKPGLRYMSNHLPQVHHLYGDEGKLPACPTHTVEEMRCVRKKTCSVRQPTKAARKVTASMVTKPCPEFNFRHKISLLAVGKRILSNKFWKTIVSCMKSKRVLQSMARML